MKASLGLGELQLFEDLHKHESLVIYISSKGDETVGCSMLFTCS